MSAPMEVDVVTDSLTMKDLANYFRSRDGGSHNRRFAEKLAREVTKNPGQSKELLPTGWHEILHPKNKRLVYQVSPAGLPSLGKRR